MNERLAAWAGAEAPVAVDVPGPELTTRRTWRCSLPEGEASIPCGGTHVRGTGELRRVEVALTLEEAALTMRTTCGRCDVRQPDR
ncbi:hypothetical protein FE391_21520 [Nonomuraea sp. KC401]|uniref:hypothetical protein n=1 Tax=unclassified Nonomuraea TaxID=2593643 RepID=UPI0010FE77BE|nr:MULTISPECIES: hypothetical protein [unclassified Nonomuraea]NBE98796.1 hypothetical protein [Nonomuraea sp. K271]TLF68672.1 hypothetical protein FE391_21520 [Nonomuraea sp. KC401]